MYGSNEDSAPLDHDQDLRDRDQFNIDKSEIESMQDEIDLVRHRYEYECAEVKARESDEWDDLRFAMIDADSDDDERKINELHAMVIAYQKIVNRAYRNSWGEVEPVEDKPRFRVY
jgi:uncharacterized protein YlxP (DUF503 family)